MSQFVTRKKFAKEMGLSERAFEAWIYPKEKAPLREGKHYYKVRGKILVDKREVAKWIRAQVTQGSEFPEDSFSLESQEKAGAIRKKSAPNQKLTWKKQTGKDSD
tara:strand:- start:55 stop:369 length:315 start_codon:yes stop_codon:yes gene_type:complete